MSLTRSLIPQQHRPILDQLLVRLSLRQGQGIVVLGAFGLCADRILTAMETRLMRWKIFD
jgi:hypothetical protein